MFFIFVFHCAYRYGRRTQLNMKAEKKWGRKGGGVKGCSRIDVLILVGRLSQVSLGVHPPPCVSVLLVG